MTQPLKARLTTKNIKDVEEYCEILFSCTHEFTAALVCCTRSSGQIFHIDGEWLIRTLPLSQELLRVLAAVGRDSHFSLVL